MKNKKTLFLFSFAVLLILVLLADPSFAQCSMCQKIATDGANTKTAGAALNHGILYLLSLPYFMLAFIFRKQILAFYRQLRSK